MSGKVYYRFLLDEESNKALRELAYKQNMSRSAIVRELIMRGHALLKGRFTLRPDEAEEPGMDEGK